MATSAFSGTIATVVLPEISRILQVDIPALHTDQSFSNNGGDSIHALRLASACKSRGVLISVFAILNAIDLDQLVSSSKFLKPHIVHPALDSVPLNQSPSVSQDVALNGFRSPVTEGQRGFLLTAGESKTSDVVCHITEWPEQDLYRLRGAWMSALASEPIFSSRFDKLNGSWYFSERDSFAEPEWLEISVNNEEERLQNLLLQTSRVDLGVNHPLAFTIIRPSQSWDCPKSTVIWNIHHALIDGVSRNLLLRKVDILLASGRVECGPSFATFAASLRAYQTAHSEDGKLFWRHQEVLYGHVGDGAELAVPPLFIPQTFLPPREQITFDFPWGRLRNTARALRVAATSLYVAAWAATLSSVCNSKDIRFGVVFSGRNIPIANIDAVVGPLISTLPLAATIDTSITFPSFARYIHLRVSQLSEFSWTLPEHGYSPNFTSVLSVEGQDGEAALSSLNSSSPWSTSTTQFDSHIPLAIAVDSQGTVSLQYHTSRMKHHTADSISRVFSHALCVIADGTDLNLPIAGNMVPHSMEKRLRMHSQCFSKRTTEAYEEANLVSLFRRSAAAAYTEPALQKGDSEMTYGELDSQSDYVASAIVPYISPGDVVGVYSDRSMNWIVAIYAVLKAGGIYCPFDTSLPLLIRDEQFAAAKAKIFLFPSITDMVDRNTPVLCQTCVSVDDVLARRHRSEDASFQGPAILSHHPAYLCFTSGSSGKPKGVLCKHNSVVALQRDFDVRLRARPGWKIAQTMSPSFDGSIHEIFSSLSYGATLLLPDSQKDPFGHLQDVDAALLTPTAASALQPNSLPRLQVVYLVGERVPQPTCDIWAAEKIVFNMYGPTETTCGATITQLSATKPVSIGKPNPSCRVYVLDNNKYLTPPGIVGEIYVAGIQVSKGYLDLPSLNSEYFLDDTVCPELREPMYRTGDRGSWDETGELQILGRGDRQVKYRGFRVDLDDVEVRVRAVITETRGIAAVLDQDKLIVIVTPETLNTYSVRKRIADWLPYYMMPREVHALETLPMTRAGKLDYNLARSMLRTKIGGTANPGLDSPLLEEEPNAKDLSILECQIADLWKKVLRLSSRSTISWDSSFISVGGESISALKLRSEMEKSLELQVSVKDILGTSNLRELAVVVGSSGLKPQLMRYPSGGTSSQMESNLSPMERGLWALSDGVMGFSALNVSLLCRLDITIDVERLTTSLNAVLTRHAVLRSKYHGADSPELAFRTLSETPPQVYRLGHHELDAEAEVNRTFNVESDDLIRVFVTPDEMLIVAHHLVCDLTASRKIMIQTCQHYEGSELSPDGTSYVSPGFLQEINTCRTEDSTRLRFWDKYLEDRPPKQVPRQEQLVKVDKEGRSFVTKLEPGFFAGAQSFARLHEATTHQFFLAVVALATSRPTDDDGCLDTTIGATHLNREEPQHEDMVGLFIQPLPIRLRWSGYSCQFTDLLSLVKQSSREALSNAIPWELLRKHLSEQNTPNKPVKQKQDQNLFDIMLSVHQSSDWKECLLPGMSLQYTFPQGSSKFNCLVEWMGSNENDESFLRIEYSTGWANAQEVELMSSEMIRVAEMMMRGE